MEPKSVPELSTTVGCDKCANRDQHRLRLVRAIRIVATAMSVILAVCGTAAAVVAVLQGDTELAKTTASIAGVGVAAGAALRHQSERKGQQPVNCRCERSGPPRSQPGA
jgi:hypothetical protein